MRVTDDDSSRGIVSTKVADMRLLSMSFCVIPSIIGTALVYSLPSIDKWGRVVSVWIIYTNSASLAVSFSVIGGNVAGYTKKTTVTFLLFLGWVLVWNRSWSFYININRYCVGNIIAPQCFREEEEQEGYPTAIIAMVVSFCVLFIAPLLLRSALQCFLPFISPYWWFIDSYTRRRTNAETHRAYALWLHRAVEAMKIWQIWKIQTSDMLYEILSYYTVKLR